MTWAAAIAAIVAAVALSVRVIHGHRAKLRQKEIDAETLRLKLAMTDKREESIVTVLLDELGHERTDRRRQEQRIDVLVDEIKRRRSERPARHTEPEPVDPTRDTDPQTPSGRPRA